MSKVTCAWLGTGAAIAPTNSNNMSLRICSPPWKLCTSEQQALPDVGDEIGPGLSSSATQRKRLRSIGYTCELGERWFWPRRHHELVSCPGRMRKQLA